MSVVISVAHDADCTAIYKIFSEDRDAMHYLPHLHTEKETQEYLKGIIKEGNMLVAKKNNIVVGFAQLKNQWVNHLYVAPLHQNQGVGKALVDEMKRMSPEYLQLWVFEDNKRAIAFYEREGFRMNEKRDKEHADNEENLPDRKYVWSENSVL